MKKILFILILVIFPIISNAEELSYNEAKELIKEVMAAYYIKGSSFQYNSAKSTYGKDSPEDATSQDLKYMVCAAYVYDVYVETFGMYSNGNLDEFPQFSATTAQIGREYYSNNKNNQSKLDGNFLIYYENRNIENSTENIKYVYEDRAKFEDFIELIQPGDILNYTGHSLIVYDVITKADGTKDAIILNSTRESRVHTPIAGSTTKLIYDYFPSPKGKNNFLDIEEEGTIKYTYLSQLKQFTDGETIQCTPQGSSTSLECTIIRGYYNDNGTAKFNYNITEKNIEKSRLRNKYSGITIEKTIDKRDNNSVYLNDELTYSIKITNNSNIKYKNITYKEFYVEETIDNKTTYLSSNNSGMYEDNKIKWKIESLKPGDTITLNYKVKVKENYNNLNKIISTEGIIYENDKNIHLTTGKVENTIINKITKYKKSYSTCFNINKDLYSNIELVDKIIECSTGNNVNLVNFKFEDILFKRELPKKNVKVNVIYLKDLTDSNKDYINMILNNYWSATVVFKDGEKTFIDLPKWNDKNLIRKSTIYESDFKDGDVLIYSETPNSYTKENGIYAYIYIDGKFVGINYNGDESRNEFTYNYYTNLYTEEKMSSKFYYKYNFAKDNQEKLNFINYQTLYGKENYVILRPEKIMRELVSIELPNNPKTEYEINEKNFELNNDTIKLIYSNGDIEDLDVSSNDIEISGFDTSVAGVKQINIKYLDVNKSYEIIINENEKQEENPPTGELNGIRIIVTMSIILLLSIVIIKYRKKEIYKI